jgi:hypothetical protein
MRYSISLGLALAFAAICIITTARAMPANNPRNTVRSVESLTVKEKERLNTSFGFFACISIGAIVLCFMFWLFWHRRTERKANQKSDSQDKGIGRSMQVSMKLQQIFSQKTLGNNTNEDDQMALVGEVAEKEASTGKAPMDNTREAMPEAPISAHLQ